MNEAYCCWPSPRAVMGPQPPLALMGKPLLQGMGFKAGKAFAVLTKCKTAIKTVSKRKSFPVVSPIVG